MELLIGEILATVWIILNSILFAPYAAYQASRFYKHKTIPFIFHRKPDMVLAFCICCIFTVAFIMPLCYGWEIFSKKELPTEHLMYIIILYAIAATFIIGFWRAWHVWFDAQYKMEAATNTWAKHLNNSESDMFLKYKNTFGNPKWTKKCLILIAIVLTSILVLLVIWLKEYVIIEGIVILIILLTFIGLFFVIRRLSRVKDEILLRREHIYFAAFGCLYGSIFGILFIISHDWGSSTDSQQLEVLYDALYLIIPSPVLYCLILIQTQWVLYQYNKWIEVENTKMDINNNAVDDLNENGVLIVSLKDIMSDFEGYKVFMEYLVKCVSAENLLYVSEVTQFMRSLTKQYNVKASSIQLQTYFDQYCIPKILPKSSIMTTIDATSVRFLRLCEKYVLEGSEFEINISHKHRKNLVNMYRLLESRINEFNPKINKLQSLFGNESDFVASRRASHTKYSQTEDDIKVDRINAHKTHTKAHSSNKISHSCIEDFQLLSNTDDIIQQIYDYLCSSLGDVYTNLNDGCIRFMQTDVYFRWYRTNYKKEQVLQEEDELESVSGSSHSMNKPQLQTNDTMEIHEINECDNEDEPFGEDEDAMDGIANTEDNGQELVAVNIDEQETEPMNKMEVISDDIYV